MAKLQINQSSFKGAGAIVGFASVVTYVQITYFSGIKANPALFKYNHYYVWKMHALSENNFLVLGK